MPNDLEVTFKTGAACWRLYSERSTRRTTCWTSSRGNPYALAICSGGFVAFYIGLKDWVENLVGRQRVSVLLVRAQFGGGRLFKNRARNHLAFAVKPAANGIDAGLDQVANYGQRANHWSPVEGAVANCHLDLFSRSSTRALNLFDSAINSPRVSGTEDSPR